MRRCGIAERRRFVVSPRFREIKWLKLTTRSASYGEMKFGVAVRSIPKPLFDFESDEDVAAWKNISLADAGKRRFLGRVQIA